MQIQLTNTINSYDGDIDDDENIEIELQAQPTNAV